jgi:hypothetical protein
MNVRLKYDFPFTAGIYHNGNFYMNNYALRVLMATVSEDPNDQTTAFERLKYFIYTCMESTIFIDTAETEQCNRYVQAGLNITTMPGAPVDQLIGIMLYHKLNAVMENRMIVLKPNCPVLWANTWFIYTVKKKPLWGMYNPSGGTLRI